MAGLRSSLEALGFQDVVTYVQSGNAVFRSRHGGEHEVAAQIRRRIAADFGTDVAVLLRTPDELDAVSRGNPFLALETDPTRLHVVFLDRPPTADAVAALDPDRSPPDAFGLVGRELYLHLPNGSGRTKLTIDWFERRLGIVATARNWRTVTKLVELSR
jgi:uncharacterized protein (DUF1697 family)